MLGDDVGRQPLREGERREDQDKCKGNSAHQSPITNSATVSQPRRGDLSPEAGRLARLERVVAVGEPAMRIAFDSLYCATSSRVPNGSRSPCTMSVRVFSASRCSVRSFSGAPGGWNG